MDVNDCVKIGFITKAHGIKGEVRISLEDEEIIDLEEIESVYVLQGTGLTQFILEEVRPQPGNEVLLKFKGVATRNESELLARNPLYVAKADLPEPEEGEFYYHEIMGFQVVDDKLGALGEVIGVEPMPGQDLLRMRYQGREVLIPMAEHIVKQVDRDARTVQTHLPEGLLEVYLGGGEEA
jgi:16S rRNA processing protein RimM